MLGGHRLAHEHFAQGGPVVTLVLAVANRDYVIQLADRRLTADGGAVEEEAGKCGSLLCDDARLLFGFTGVARAGSFETQRWILDLLYACGAPDYAVYSMLQRFRDRATEDFRSLAPVKGLPPDARRLAILFTGYLHTHEPPVIGSALISNYLNAVTDELSPVAFDEFQSFYTSEKEPGAHYSTYVQRIGAHHAMAQADVDALRVTLRERKPADAIIGKATEMLLAMADRPGSGGTIGKQISWLKLLPDAGTPVRSGYYSNIPTRVVYMPSSVIAQSSCQVEFDGGVLCPEDADGPPVAVPKVARRAPCPCGSGKRYKNCHGHARGRY